MKVKKAAAAFLAGLISATFCAGVIPYGELPTLGTGLTVSAEEEPFNYDMFKASVIASHSENTQAHENLMTWLDYLKSPNTALFEVMQSDTGFKVSIAAWEAENIVFNPSESAAESLDEVGYYESIILSTLKNITTADEFLDKYVTGGAEIAQNIYSFFEDDLDLVFYITNYKELSPDQVKDFGAELENAFKVKYPHMQKAYGVLEKIDIVFAAVDTLADCISNIANYVMGCQMSDDITALVSELYQNCDEAANSSMKTALSNVLDACKAAGPSIAGGILEEVVSGVVTGGIQITAQFADFVWKDVVAAFPLAKIPLLTEAITKGVVNVLFSTDKICEQYYKAERMYNYEMLVRSTIRKICADYPQSPSEEKAGMLFASINLLANTFQASGELAIDFAETVYSDNLLGKLFGPSEELNNFTAGVRHSCSTSEDYRRSILETSWLFALETEYPEEYKAYMGDKDSDPEPYVKVLEITLDKEEYEVGLEDNFFGVTATIAPENATNKNLIYSSSDPNIARCNDCFIDPVSVGTAVITVSSADGSASASATIHVVEGHGADGFYIETPDIEIKPEVGETFTTGGLKYRVTGEDTAELTGYDSEEPEGHLYIPDSVGCKSALLQVISIRYDAFSGCTGLKSVTIPDTVTAIESYHNGVSYGAFAGCTGLTSIVIPNSVKSVGGYTFQNCTGLESVTVYGSDTSFGSNVFSEFKGIIRGHNDSTAQAYAEEYGYQFESLDGETPAVTETTAAKETTTTESTTTTAMESTTTNATDPTDTTTELPTTQTTTTTVASGEEKPSSGHCGAQDNENNVQWIFDAKTGMLTISGTGDMMDCLSGAPWDGLDYTEVVIENGVSNIGAGAFQGNASLSKVTIPESVTSIGKDAFAGCENLEFVFVESDDCEIDSEAFGTDTFNGTIYASEGSTAEAFAEENGLQFESIDETPAESTSTTEITTTSTTAKETTTTTITPTETTTSTTETTTTTAEQTTTTLSTESTTTSTDTTTRTTPSETMAFGDVDNSGGITIDDATMTLQVYTNQMLHVDAGVSDDVMKAMDLDEDGVVTIDDATYILAYYTAESVTHTPMTWYEITGNPNAPGAPE